MKILILSDSFPPESKGGADRIAFNLVNGFVKKGHQVFVITTTQDKKKSTLNHQVQAPNIYRIYVPYYHQRWKAYLSLYNPLAVSQVKRIIKQIKPDIVHAHNIHYYLSYHCLKIAKKYSQAVFLTAHDAMLFHYGKLTEFLLGHPKLREGSRGIPKINYKVTPWQQIKRFKKRYNPFRNIIIRHYLKYVNKIFVVSYALKDTLGQNGLDNLEVIHNGIDVDDWQVADDKIGNFIKKYNLFNKKIIFFGGRLSALKGGEKVLRAMKIVIEELPEAVLLVAGKKDDYTQKMLELASSQDVPLILTAWIKEDELKSAYWSSHIVAVPSIYFDPFPTVNLESMACQKPVVGTCFGGTPEIVQDGETGYIVNPFDIQTMAKKIIDLLKNPQKAEQFGEAGYKRVKKYFSLDQQVAKTLKFYYQYVT